jgi:hypothetical protein
MREMGAPPTNGIPKIEFRQSFEGKYRPNMRRRVILGLIKKDTKHIHYQTREQYQQWRRDCKTPFIFESGNGA